MPAADTAAGTPLQSHHRRHSIRRVHHRTRKHQPAVPLPTGNSRGTCHAHLIRGNHNKPDCTDGSDSDSLKPDSDSGEPSTISRPTRPTEGTTEAIGCFCTVRAFPGFLISVSCVAILDSCPDSSFAWCVYFFGSRERWEPYGGGTARRSAQNL